MSLAQGNNTPIRPRIEPGSPDPESDALTTRPVRSPPIFIDETYLELYADDTTFHYASKNKIVLRSKLQKGSNDFLN